MGEKKFKRKMHVDYIYIRNEWKKKRTSILVYPHLFYVKKGNRANERMEADCRRIQRGASHRDECCKQNWLFHKKTGTEFQVECMNLDSSCTLISRTNDYLLHEISIFYVASFTFFCEILINSMEYVGIHKGDDDNLKYRSGLDSLWILCEKNTKHSECCENGYWITVHVDKMQSVSSFE